MSEEKERVANYRPVYVTEISDSLHFYTQDVETGKLSLWCLAVRQCVNDNCLMRKIFCFIHKKKDRPTFSKMQLSKYEQQCAFAKWTPKSLFNESLNVNTFLAAVMIYYLTLTVLRCEQGALLLFLFTFNTALTLWVSIILNTLTFTSSLGAASLLPSAEAKQRTPYLLLPLNEGNKSHHPHLSPATGRKVRRWKTNNPRNSCMAASSDRLFVCVWMNAPLTVLCWVAVHLLGHIFNGPSSIWKPTCVCMCA